MIKCSLLFQQLMPQGSSLTLLDSFITFQPKQGDVARTVANMALIKIQGGKIGMMDDSLSN